MALETGTYISDLVATNPVAGDPKSQGDDHIRLLKSTIKATFPNINAAVTATDEELNFVDGVTSSIQTQIDLKAPLASPEFTGVPIAPTAETGSTGTQIATLDYVVATALSSSLPGQTGNAGKLLSTDGVNGGWHATIDDSVVSLLAGGDIVGTTKTQTLTDKTATDLILADDADPTKKANFVLSGVTAGQNRALTIADEDMTLFTPGMRLLSTVTASNSATVDIETTFDTTYDDYVIYVSNLSCSSASQAPSIRFKIGGSYLATGYSFRDYDQTLSSGQPYIEIYDSIGLSTRLHFRVHISMPSETGIGHSIYMDGVNNVNGLPTNQTGYHATTGALTGIRFLMSSGNIATGNFKLFGIRKS
jgi:hypothetical protein